MLREMKRLLRTIGSGFQFMLLLILRSPFSLCMTVMQAVFLQYAFNAVDGNDNNQLTAVCLVFGVASIFLFLYNGTIWSIYASFVVRMEGRLRIELFEKITKFSYERLEADSHGEWMTRLNTDVQMPFSQPVHLPHAVNAILQIAVSAVILWYMNPAMFGWVMLFIIPHIIISRFFIAQAMPELNKKSLEATAVNTSKLTALITCADIAALYDGQDYLMKRFEQSSLCLLKAKMKIRNRNAINTTITSLFSLGGYLALLIVSSAGIAVGQFTFGDLTATFQYRGGALSGAMMLINCLISIHASMVGIGRINELMYEKTEESNG